MPKRTSTNSTTANSTATNNTARTRERLKTPLIPGDGPLAGVPAPLAFLVVLGLFAAGVLVGGVPGTLLLGVLVAGIAVLLAGTWRVLGPGDRALRVLVLVIVAGIALAQLW